MSSCNKDPNNVNAIYFAARLGSFDPFTGFMEQLESFFFNICGNVLIRDL